MLEKTGTVLEKFQIIEVGEPRKTDTHKHSFVGTVIDVLESRGTVIVENQSREVFEADADNVKVIND